MSAYAGNPRVFARSDVSFDVFVADGTVAAVSRPSSDNRWVARREIGTYANFDTADEAIRSLIGDPR